MKILKNCILFATTTLSGLHCGVSYLNAMESNDDQRGASIYPSTFEEDENPNPLSRRTPYSGGNIGAPYAGGQMGAPYAGCQMGAPYAGGNMGAPYAGEQMRAQR